MLRRGKLGERNLQRVERCFCRERAEKEKEGEYKKSTHLKVAQEEERDKE